MKKKLSILLSFAGIAALVAYISISCKKEPLEIEPQLSVSDTALIVAAVANSTDTFTISSNISWTVSSSESWLTVNPTSGSNDGTVIVTAEENTNSTARTAKVTVSAEGAASQNVIVTQRGTLWVSPTSLFVDAAENSTDTFAIASDTIWTVSSSESWLTVSPTSGSNNGTVIVTAQQNTGVSERTATVTVSAAGSPEQFVTVTQSGALLVSRTWIELEPAENSTDTFTIYSNTTWMVLSSESWLSVSPTSGSNNGIATVTATEANPISKGRIATVSISTTGDMSQTVTVAQLGIQCAPEDESYCEVPGCIIPDMPSYSSLPDNPYLPDPFTFLNGSPVTTIDDWTCRRAEIAVLAQEFEYGYKPCTPYSATTGSFSGNTITVTVTGNGKTISFDCQIYYPSSGSAPYPAMIGIGFSFLDNTLLSDLGVAVISFPNDEVANQTSAGDRGKGKFYEFFCHNQSAGALMAWSWGVSRLIDALEKTPQTNIDPTRLGVTGCSRNGKGALCAGAFDERIVLTIPQESGAGGSASWRVSDSIPGTQRLQQIVGENCWFRENFYQFSYTVPKLPFDHHMIEGLVAPRALLVIENDILWLGAESTWVCANAAHMIWEALGVPDKMGYSGTNAHNHCAYPASQQPELSAYVGKFLVGTGTGDTNIMLTEPGYVFDSTRWVNWTVPTLE